jgi:hypothetical protein
MSRDSASTGATSRAPVVDRVGATPEAQAAEGLLFLAAGYAAISGWVIGFNALSPALTATNLILGDCVHLTRFSERIQSWEVGTALKGNDRVCIRWW